MATNRSLPFLAISELPKIPKIRKRPLEPEEEFNQKLTKTSSLLSTTALPKQDYLSIYNNKTILFLGDSSIRVLYRDLVKFLSCDRLLDYTEAACANGHYKTVPGEILVKSNGAIGSDDYENIRIFRIEKQSVTIIYIHFATLFHSKAIEQLNYLRETKLRKSIDLIFCCSYTSDINQRKVSKLGTDFSEYLEGYMKELENILVYLKVFCRNKKNQKQLFYWITPHPTTSSELFNCETDFDKYVTNTNRIGIENGYVIYNRLDLWRRRPDLVINKTGFFTLHGVRDINDQLARDVANKWQKPFTSSIPPRVM